MDLGLDAGTILLGVAIFAARVVDVTIGTIRTISTVRGRTKAAFLLGLAEISIWLLVIAAVIADIHERPILGLFYALGFSTGNVVGILVERRLAFGYVVLRVFARHNGARLAQAIRKGGHSATTFEGKGGAGPVIEVCVVCRRKALHEILGIVRDISPKAFHIIELAGTVSRPLRAAPQPATGWRAVLKKK